MFAMRTLVAATFVTFLAAGGACTEEVKTNGEEGNNNGGGNGAAGDSGNAAESNTVYADAYYASFDGTNNYDLLLLGERTVWTVKDTSIADVEEEDLDIDEDTLDSLLKQQWTEIEKRLKERCTDDRKDRFCNQTYDDFKKEASRRFRVVRITPKKAGVTQLIAGQRGGRRGGEGRSKSLVVTGFSPSDFDAGKQRYTAAGAGNLKACASCHLAGEEKAPPHSLGRVKDFSDSAIRQWITTGAYDGVKASITHTWEFSSDAQKRGIVPYLRSLQAKDVNTLAKQHVSELAGEFEDGIGGSSSNTR